MSVLRARFIDDEQHPCHDQESADALDAVETVTYVAARRFKKDERRLSRIRQELEDGAQEGARRDAGRAGGEAAGLRRQGEAAREARRGEAGHDRGRKAPHLRGAPRRRGRTSHHQPGIYDDAMRLAVRRFQQKHMIYEANFLRRKTVEALSRSLLDNDYDALVRALRERVVSAAGILEDGVGLQGAQPGRRVHQGGARPARPDRRRRRAGLLQAPRARTSSRRCGWRSSCRRGPTTTRPTWTSRSSSIAATSGTTCRSTTRGTTSRRRARSTRR